MQVIACRVILPEFLCNVFCSHITWHLYQIKQRPYFLKSRISDVCFLCGMHALTWKKISGFARKIWTFRVKTFVWFFKHMRNLQIMGVIDEVASFQRKQLFFYYEKLLSNCTILKFLSIVFHLQASEDLQCCWSGKVVFVRCRFLPHSSVNKLIKRSVRRLPFYASDWFLSHSSGVPLKFIVYTYFLFFF